MAHGTDSKTITFRQLATMVDEAERQLAYGSETCLLDHVDERMSELGGDDWRESDAVVPNGEANWWIRAYELYAADQAKPADEQCTELQELFDAV